jgi:hypothetical protein
LSDPSAITLGIKDIYYDPDTVTLNGGDLESLKTIVEELVHVEQFLQNWTHTEPNPKTVEYTGDLTISYFKAQTSWKNRYINSAIKGLIKTGDSYKNDIEKSAKNKTFDVLTELRSRVGREGGEFKLCGFSLYGTLDRPNY